MKEILSDVTVPCHAVGSFVHQPSFASRSSPPLHWKGISVQSCPSLPLSLFCRTWVSWADTVCPVLSYKVHLNCLTIWVYSFQFSDECFKCSHSKWMFALGEVHHRFFALSKTDLEAAMRTPVHKRRDQLSVLSSSSSVTKPTMVESSENVSR